MPVNNLIQLRKGDASSWTSENPVLASGEPGFDVTNNILKIGDGLASWSELVAIGSGFAGAGGLSNVVEDITPQLGGNLDINSYSVTGIGNININGNITANYVYSDLSGTIVTANTGNFTTLQVNGTAVPTGVGTTNYVTKWTGTNSIGNSVVYDNGTNVGIGTASPVEKLYVNGSIGNLGWRINEGAITTTGSGVGNGVAITLNAQFGTTLTTTFQYKVRLTTYGTATNTGATYLVHYNTSTSAWVLREVGLEGNTSNHPLLAESDGELIAYTNNATGYGIRYLVESYNTADADSTPNSMGADYHWQRLGNNLYYVDGNVSIGTTTTINRLNVEGGNIVFNDLGGNYDFRVEGDTDPNLLFVDASVDDVGIGTNNPAAKLHIAGDTLFENLSYRRFTTSIATATHFRKYTDIAHYANSVSSVAGSLRIEIPVTTSTMWSMDVVIVEYDGGNGNNIKTTNLTITGYTTTNTNRGVWTNNPSRINQVRFGRNTANNRTVILIDPVSVFRYPKAYIKEINTHHGNETTFGNSANYAITITSDETNFTLNGTITNDQFIRDDKLVNTFDNQTVAGNKTFDGNVVINEIGGNFDFRVEGDTDQYLLFTDASADKVSIGTSSMNGKLNITDSSTNQSNKYLNYCYGSHTSSTNGAYYAFGDNINVYKLVNSGVTDAGYAMGSDIVSVLNGNGTLTSTYGLRTYAGIYTGSSAGTNTAAYGIQSRVINFGDGSSLINEARGIDIYINGDSANNKAAAGITTARALFINTILDATNKWAIYQEGASDTNYFAANVGIGTNAPSAKLNVENGNVIFNDNGGNYDFRVEGDTDPNLLFTDASTDRVGIGTDSPTNKLTVIGAASFGTLERTPNNADAAGFYNRIEAGGGTQTTKSYGSIWLYNSNNTQTHSFHSYPGTDNYINNGGNFGIGTSSPSYKLDITGDIGLTNGGFYTSPTGTILGTNGWIYQSGQVVNSQGSFSSSGDSQSSQYILRTSTTNNTWTPVKNNGSNAILLASNRTYSFSINIVARRTNGQDNAGYKLEGVLYNDGYGADFVGSPTKTVLAESDSTWDVRVSISGAGAGGTDYLLTEVLGASSKNINWAVKADLLEVGGNISSYTEANALSLDDEFIP